MAKVTSTRGTTGRRRVSQVHARKSTATHPRTGAAGPRRTRADPRHSGRKSGPQGRAARPRTTASGGPSSRAGPAPAPVTGPRREANSTDQGLLRSWVSSLYERVRFGIGHQNHEVTGLLMVLAGVLIILAFFGAAGRLGEWVMGALQVLVGAWAYLTPAVLIGLGVLLVIGRRQLGFRRLMVGTFLGFTGSLALFHLLLGASPLVSTSLDELKRAGGWTGSLIAYPLERLLGFAGSFVVISVFLSSGVMLVVQASIRDVAVAGGRSVAYAARGVWAGTRRRPAGRATPDQAPRAPKRPNASSGSGGKQPQRPPRTQAPKRPSAPSGSGGKQPQRPPRTQAPKRRKARPKVAGKEPQPPSPPPAGSNLGRAPEPSAQVSDEKPSQPPTPPPPPRPADDGAYQLPPIELLETGPKEGQSRRMLEETARQLEDALRNHDVDAELTNIVPGPTITRYEIELAPGVKVSKVTRLSSDIAYALATPDVRLIAPIPGRSAIGVEVPNRVRRLVTLGDVLASNQASRMEHPLVVGLGADISGQPVLLNLAQLPHVLIAGATGAGKSSCINSIVTSLLARTEPENVRLIMVDPKRVELGQYNGVPHLLTRVITKPKKALDALQWAVAEMDRRYDLLADAGVRDIEGYRQKFDAGKLDGEAFDRFPYLVVLIDELNDLMMVAGRDVESAIVRIAQMARAVGIHLVIATQRPSVNVITGVIKANVPSRLAFSVASQTDSRVIIDTVGADKLIGMGDMLVVTAREPRARRVQGAWVSEEEVSAVVDWVKAQKGEDYRPIAEEAATERRAAADEAAGGEDAELVQRATQLVVRSQLGSTSMLQRKLRIGFARAGRIMDTLEQQGIVGPSEGSKAREVLVTVEELESSASLPA